MGVGRAIADGNILNVVADHLSQLAGQKEHHYPGQKGGFELPQPRR